MSEETKRGKLSAAVDELADCVEWGHLLASTGSGEDLLLAAADRIQKLTRERDNIKSWATCNMAGAHTDRDQAIRKAQTLEHECNEAVAVSAYLAAEAARVLGKEPEDLLDDAKAEIRKAMDGE